VKENEIPWYTQSMENEMNGFFIELGQRIAAFRKDAGLTQTQLADKLEVKQQIVAAYEKGIRRIPASQLVPLSKALFISIDELLGVKDKKKRGPASSIQKKLAEIDALPPSQKKSLLDTIDNYLRANS
jgi:transcriptional regulator with XRE-family HTH domain